MIWVLFISGALLLAAVLFFFLRRGVRLLPPPAREYLPAKEEELPAKYGVDEIVALVKDPYWLHAYWEVTAAKQQEISQMFGPQAWEESRPVIRVYDVTAGDDPDGGGNTPYFDVEIDEGANNWYLYLGQPNRSFRLELGRLLPGGRFLRLARSSRVTLPSNAPSALIDPLWPPLEQLWAGQGLAWGRTTGTSPVGWGISSPQLPAQRGG